MIRAPWRERLREALDAAIFALSVYGVPAAIGAVTLVALVAWDRVYEREDPVPLAIAVLEERGAALSPAEAAARLRAAPAVPHRDTRLSEAPFWFAFTAARTRRQRDRAAFAARAADRVLECAQPGADRRRQPERGLGRGAGAEGRLRDPSRAGRRGCRSFAAAVSPARRASRRSSGRPGSWPCPRRRTTATPGCWRAGCWCSRRSSWSPR
jgi:hypothetical protein